MCEIPVNGPNKPLKVDEPKHDYVENYARFLRGVTDKVLGDMADTSSEAIVEPSNNTVDPDTVDYFRRRLDNLERLVGNLRKDIGLVMDTLERIEDALAEPKAKPVNVVFDMKNVAEEVAAAVSKVVDKPHMCETRYA